LKKKIALNSKTAAPPSDVTTIEITPPLLSFSHILIIHDLFIIAAPPSGQKLPRQKVDLIRH
jgi:hypothetical protein